MVPVSYPGVYVVEVPSGVHTITGVATSITAFFGRTSRGPLNKAVRVLSPSDFTRAFGKAHPSSDLAQSLKQFFDNGGNDCYVVRLAKKGTARKSGVTLKTAGGTNVLVATAKTEGVWGDGVRLEVDYATANPDDNFNLRVTQEDNGAVVATESFSSLSMDPSSPRFAPLAVSQASNLIDIAVDAGLGDPMSGGSVYNAAGTTQSGYSRSNRVFSTAAAPALATDIKNFFAANGKFQISINGSQLIAIDLTGLDPTAPAPAAVQDVADRIAAAINTQVGAVLAGTTVSAKFDPVTPGALNLGMLRLTSNSGSRTSVTVVRASSNDIAGALMLGVDQGGIEVTRYANLRPVPTGTTFLGGTSMDAFSTGLGDLAGVQQNTITGITVAGTNVPVNLVTTANADRFYVSAGGGNDGIREKLALLANAVNQNASLGWTASVWGYHLALKKTAGTINDVGAVSLTGAPPSLANVFLTNVRKYTLGSTGLTGANSFQTAGVAGSDGDAPEQNDYLGDELTQTGFHALDAVDIFNLMVLPNDRDVPAATRLNLWGPASIYCQEKRAFLLIDAPDSWTQNGRPVAKASDVNALRSLVVKDHSAVFYPAVKYSDNGVLKTMGPSGLIAGLMSRIDSTRGVWKAPAGVEADLRGIVDLAVNLTDKENGVLNKLGANCLRKFPAGIVNWGARTLDGSDDLGSEWKYIPIRRLALFLEESLYRGTTWVVFQPNDEPLWAKIRLNLNAFMMGLFRQGAFQGSTPDKAFYVKCDGETTTQNDRNLGIVNIEVGFAPLKPAEFVVIRIQQIAGDLQ